MGFKVELVGKVTDFSSSKIHHRSTASGDRDPGNRIAWVEESKFEASLVSAKTRYFRSVHLKATSPSRASSAAK